MPAYEGSCHCGAVQFRIAAEITDVYRCDCSLCRRRGAIVASVPLSGIRILQGEVELRCYQFNTRTAKHYFCSVCGIYTHHQRRSNPSEYGFNVACIIGVDISALGPIGVGNGASQSVAFAP